MTADTALHDDRILNAATHILQGMIARSPTDGGAQHDWIDMLIEAGNNHHPDAQDMIHSEELCVNALALAERLVRAAELGSDLSFQRTQLLKRAMLFRQLLDSYGIRTDDSLVFDAAEWFDANPYDHASLTAFLAERDLDGSLQSWLDSAGVMSANNLPFDTLTCKKLEAFGCPPAVAKHIITLTDALYAKHPAEAGSRRA